MVGQCGKCGEWRVACRKVRVWLVRSRDLGQPLGQWMCVSTNFLDKKNRFPIAFLLIVTITTLACWKTAAVSLGFTVRETERVGKQDQGYLVFASWGCGVPYNFWDGCLHEEGKTGKDIRYDKQ